MNPSLPSLFVPQALVNCRRISIHGLRLDASVGVFDEEKERTQPILIDINAYADLAGTTPQQDALREVLDYNQLRDIAHDVVHQGHVHLLETLTDRMARRVLEIPVIRAVCISVRKPTTFADCESVGVEVFHIKP